MAEKKLGFYPLSADSKSVGEGRERGTFEFI